MTMFDPDISKGTRVLQAIGGFLVLAIFTGVIIFTSAGWNNSAKDAREAQEDYHNQVIKTETLQSEYNKLYREFQQATGEKPKAASPESVKQIAGTPGAKGEAGDRGAQGLPGIPGLNGQNATDAQVAGAVGDYCASHGGCIGKTGQTGAAGAPGANASDAQVAAAVQAYCDAHNSCKGDTGATGAPGADSTVPGPQGEQGPAGPAGPGRGIQNVECVGDGATSSWVITYTDGSTSQTAGPCKISLTP